MKVLVNGARLHVTMRGEKRVDGQDRPAVVAVHGGPGLDAGFLRFALRPVAEFAQLVIPDLRGHGRSDLDTADHWNLDSWADDLFGLIDKLDLQTPIVLGTSFGGFVVQNYLARHPEQPAGAILVSTAPRLPSEAETVERFRQLGGEDAASAMAQSFAEATEEAQERWARHCSPLLNLRPPSAEFTRVMTARIATPEVNRHFTPSLPDMDLRPGLSKVHCPTIVIVGEQDPLVSPANADESVRAIPAGLATLHRIPDAGHQVLWDTPEVLNDLVRPFVERCASGR